MSGNSHITFARYPRTHHLWGSKLASQDKMLSEEESEKVLSDPTMTYVWESKLDGTNLGIRTPDSGLVLQNRGHVLGKGEHPQYNLLWPWTSVMGGFIKDVLGSSLVMYGEWTYALHTVKYTSLKHYFNEFDIYDMETGEFYDTERRNDLLAPLVSMNIIAQVPVIHVGMLTLEEAHTLAFGHAPIYGEEKPEGAYLKIEKDGIVQGRYKLVREEFIQTIIDENVHWRTKPVEVQGLADGVDIFSLEDGQQHD